MYPDRVGYLIEEKNRSESHGIFHAGDSHGMGPWKRYFERIKDGIFWTVPSMLRDIPKIAEKTALKKIIWIHWEDFSPGNFSCSKNIKEIINRYENLKVDQEILPYDNWVKI